MTKIRTKRLHIVGKSDHGKTTLVVELVWALTRLGYKVGTIKHSSHLHELDVPGKDSFRHRVAGATPAAIITPDLIGMFEKTTPEQDPYDRLAPLFEDCDLILVEGHADMEGLKVEVWREGRETPPLATTRNDIHAVITDDSPNCNCPIWTRSDLETLTQNVIDLMQLKSEK